MVKEKCEKTFKVFYATRAYCTEGSFVPLSICLCEGAGGAYLHGYGPLWDDIIAFILALKLVFCRLPFHTYYKDISVTATCAF